MNGIQVSIQHKNRMFKTHYLSNGQTKKLVLQNILLNKLNKLKTLSKKVFYDT